MIHHHHLRLSSESSFLDSPYNCNSYVERVFCGKWEGETNKYVMLRRICTCYMSSLPVRIFMRNNTHMRFISNTFLEFLKQIYFAVIILFTIFTFSHSTQFSISISCSICWWLHRCFSRCDWFLLFHFKKHLQICRILWPSHPFKIVVVKMFEIAP